MGEMNVSSIMFFASSEQWVLCACFLSGRELSRVVLRQVLRLSSYLSRCVVVRAVYWCKEEN